MGTATAEPAISFTKQWADKHTVVRSFSIRDADGNVVFDSSSLLDREAHARGTYNDGRSRDKGVEPEGVALPDIGGRTFAFIGLERPNKSAVVVFDVTSPQDVSFVDMIVTDGDRAPQGRATYHHRGNFYLAIANETAHRPRPDGTCRSCRERRARRGCQDFCVRGLP